MVTLRWLQSAKDDLKDIYEFIGADSKKFAKHQISQIRKRTDILKTHARAGKMVEEYGDDSIREIVISHYRIIYRVVNPNLIHIILIHHGARRMPSEL
jgi:addiction module RelE/StbE family toxin